MPSPVCGKEEPLAGMQAGGKQLCGKGPGVLAEGRALVTEEAKQQRPGLYHQVPSQWVEEGGCPLQQLGAMCTASSFRPPSTGELQMHWRSFSRGLHDGRG